MFNEYKDILSIKDVQEALGIGRATAYRLIHSEVLRHIRIGKTIKIPKKYLLDYIYGECYTEAVATGNLSCQ